MANNKDFKVKNGIEPTAYFEGNRSGAVTDGPTIDDIVDTGSYVDITTTSFLYDAKFSTDGTKIYTLDWSNNLIELWTLSTAWDLSTATNASATNWTPAGNITYRIFFRSNGTQVWTVGYDSTNTTYYLYYYTLSTAWDITTVSSTYVSRLSVSTTGGVFFKPDGYSFYIVKNSGGNTLVERWSMTTAWDISTATSSDTFTAFTSSATGSGIEFSSSGSKMFLTAIDADNGGIYEYDLSTSWDITTASLAHTVLKGDGGLPDQFFYSLTFKYNDYDTLFAISAGTDFIYQFNTALIVATVDFDDHTERLISPQAGQKLKISFANPPASGCASVRIKPTGASVSVIYDDSVKWIGGTAPDAPASGEAQIITFFTNDSGASYNALVAIDKAS